MPVIVEDTRRLALVGQAEKDLVGARVDTAQGCNPRTRTSRCATPPATSIAARSRLSDTQHVQPDRLPGCDCTAAWQPGGAADGEGGGAPGPSSRGVRRVTLPRDLCRFPATRSREQSLLQARPLDSGSFPRAGAQKALSRGRFGAHPSPPSGGIHPSPA